MSTKKWLLGAWKMPAWFYIGLSVRVRYYQASTVNFDLRQLSVEVLPIIQKFKNMPSLYHQISTFGSGSVLIG